VCIQSSLTCSVCVILIIYGQRCRCAFIQSLWSEVSLCIQSKLMVRGVVVHSIKAYGQRCCCAFNQSLWSEVLLCIQSKLMVRGVVVHSIKAYGQRCCCAFNQSFAYQFTKCKQKTSKQNAQKKQKKVGNTSLTAWSALNLSPRRLLRW
jgi:hypothetical protein